MPVKYNEIVPWGRNLEEYIKMFDLTEEDKKKKIISCGDGPASFNYEGTKLDMDINSVDPIYKFTKEELKRKIDETYEMVLKQTRENQEKFVWKDFKNVEELGKLRLLAMNNFLEDYELGLKERRYQVGELPNLEIEDEKYDLALSSHFLFLYSENLSLEFHIKAIEEMLRVAKEVRIFPILDNNAKESKYYLDIVRYFRKKNYDVDTLKVNYEFQKDGNKMLKIIKG